MSISDFLYHHEGTYKNQLKSHEDLEKDLQSEPRNHYLETKNITSFSVCRRSAALEFENQIRILTRLNDVLMN